MGSGSTPSFSLLKNTIPNNAMSEVDQLTACLICLRGKVAVAQNTKVHEPWKQNALVARYQVAQVDGAYDERPKQKRQIKMRVRGRHRSFLNGYPATFVVVIQSTSLESANAAWKEFSSIENLTSLIVTTWKPYVGYLVMERSTVMTRSSSKYGEVSWTKSNRQTRSGHRSKRILCFALPRMATVACRQLRARPELVGVAGSE
jgi:hypothetical protein